MKKCVLLLALMIAPGVAFGQDQTIIIQQSDPMEDAEKGGKALRKIFDAIRGKNQKAPTAEQIARAQKDINAALETFLLIHPDFPQYRESMLAYTLKLEPAKDLGLVEYLELLYRLAKYEEAEKAKASAPSGP